MSFRIFIMGFLRVPSVFILVLLLSAGALAAHSPQFADGNTSPETALEIEDTVKSWAFYSHLHQGEALYFTFEIQEGERLLLNLIVPVKDGDDGFAPRMVMMAPGIADQGAIPSWVEVPEGYGYQVIDTSLPEEATYEGFSPSAFYDLGRTDSPAPVTGKYYVAVFAPAALEGNFALVIGYGESFTAQEWLLIPFNLYTVYLWEGQEPWEILAPMVLTAVLGSLLIAYYRKRRSEGIDLQHALLLLSGLLITGTAASTMVQTMISVRDSHLGPEVMISVFLFLIPGLLGLFLLLKGWKVGPLTKGDRVKVAIIGSLAILAWAGYLVGPILAIVSALLPERIGMWPSRQKMPK
ncbi:MAG: hypothetical protein AB9860_01480 [Methanomassiliicoccales archaeon]